MHHYEYHKRSLSSLRDARKYGWLFEYWLSSESIEARYWLLEYLHTHLHYDEILQSDNSGKPIPFSLDGTNYFWSLSHTDHYIAFSFASSPTGIDIVEVRPRNEELFATHDISEYEILGWVSWENFYILWSSKEAIIKAYGNTLDDMKRMVLKDKVEENYIFEFLTWIHKIRVCKSGSIIIALL